MAEVNATVETALAVIPARDPRALVKNSEAAAVACRELLGSCVVEIRQGGQVSKHLRVEGWSMLAAAHGLTPGSDEPHRLEDSQGRLIGYKARGWVRDSEGRELGAAWGMVSTDERNWRGKPEFQLASMAQTRAVAKAARLALGHAVALLKLPGLVATPAEEMEAELAPHIPKAMGEALDRMGAVPMQDGSEFDPFAGDAEPIHHPQPPLKPGPGLASPKQLGLIGSLVRKLKTNHPKLADDLREEYGDPDQLTKTQASEIIERLQGMGA